MTPWGTRAHESGATATFDSHRVTPLPGCARAGSRGAKWRERGSPPVHVTEDRPYMCRLSLVEGDHPSGAKVV
jgi:hypothetical protein